MNLKGVVGVCIGDRGKMISYSLKKRKGGGWKGIV